ncbi:cobalamin B12-binding domain-containing protein [Peribacillus deserti]|uniref:Cobalamin-binding protein n=1 Tax=Peribacillus deserti TaxID=673318 RepID=A0A2N5M5G7_9BACI|nr:cobalamin-dependent protein [Peribacillus deserti]PLT29599.1 cobalamin-binding protein [Peribacillus deserti]
MDDRHKAFARILLEGNVEAALEYIKQYNYFDRFSIFDHIVTPSLFYIGELWEQNEISVADEHLATGVCDFVLSRLYPPAGSAGSLAKKAMFFCLEGEQHYLGLKMVSSLFEEKGWSTRNLGPNLPLEYAFNYARDWRPNIIGLSVSIVYHLPKLKTCVEALAKLPYKPIILVGGRLAGKYDLEPYCENKAVILKDLESLESWVSQTILGEKLDALS